MKKNILTWSAIGISLLCIMITGCKCNETEKEAWTKFLQHAKECSDQRDAFMANCNRQKEADAWAELQTCNNSCEFNIGACGLDINCIIDRMNERVRCLNACTEKYRQKIISNEECERKWNDAFWDCLNTKPK